MTKRLSKSSKNKLETLHETMLKKGISAEKALQMNAKQWRKEFGGKKTMSKTSLAGRKRNIQSLRKHQKTVLDFKFKKRGISNLAYQKAIKKLTNHLLKRRKPKKRKKRKPIDVKINGSFHKRKKSITLRTLQDLQDFLDDLHKSSKQYSRKYKMVVYSDSVERVRNSIRVYQNFDYGEEINV